MNRVSVHSAEARLEAAFARVRSIPFENEELKSDCSRYLCVLVCGFVETAAVALVLGYVSDVSHPRAVRLVQRQLSRRASLNSERLIQLVGAMDDDWGMELRNFLTDERKAALDSVVALRHKIAHGESVGLNFVTICEYYQYVKEVVRYLGELLTASSSSPASDG